jgi:hypothetical protein
MLAPGDRRVRVVAALLSARQLWYRMLCSCLWRRYAAASSEARAVNVALVCLLAHRLLLQLTIGTAMAASALSCTMWSCCRARRKGSACC